MNLLCNIEGCSYLAEKNGICGRHNREARKSAAPKEKPKRQRISKTADPEREKIYLAIRDLYLSVNTECKLCVLDSLWTGRVEKATDVHHKKGRIGELLFDVRHFLPVCRNHHTWIEQNPKSSKAWGFSESRHAIETV